MIKLQELLRFGYFWGKFWWVIPRSWTLNACFFGIMAFLSEGIPAKLLSAEINPTESMFFKLNFHRNKMLVNFLYNTSGNTISSHLETSGKSLYIYSANYDKILLLGNFNVSFWDHIMEEYLFIFGFRSLITNPT